MYIILVAATSIDGKITKWDSPDVSSWSSREDQSFFAEALSKAELVMMGSGTYNVSKSDMKHSPGRLRAILTNDPAKYSRDQIPAQLEFFSDKPQEVVSKLSARGYKTALLLGGEKLYTSFLEANLVDELWITLEPKIFGKGKSLAGEGLLDVSLRLVQTSKLNSDGTILLKYEVI